MGRLAETEERGRTWVKECTRQGDESPIPKSPSAAVALPYISEAVPFLGLADLKWALSLSLSLSLRELEAAVGFAKALSLVCTDNKVLM